MDNGPRTTGGITSETQFNIRGEAVTPDKRADVAMPGIPGGWATREVAVGGRRVRLTLPADPDAFLDDPAVHAAHDRTGYMPYWPYLWPAAISMAQLVLDAPWPPGADVLEVGAGVGLVGLAALARGDRVTFNDYQADAVEIALYNALQNGYPARGACFDWKHPPAERYRVILGCDVVYDVANHGPLLRLLDRMLTKDGIAWFGDPCRERGDRFIVAAKREGFAVDVADDRRCPLEDPAAGRFQLIQLSRDGRRPW